MVSFFIKKKEKAAIPAAVPLAFIFRDTILVGSS